MFVFYTTMALLSAVLLPTLAMAADEPIRPTPKIPEPTQAPYTNNLLGSLGGMRDTLSDNGVEVFLAYRSDSFAVTDGGIKRGGNYLDNLDLRFDIDNAKLLGIAGNKAAIHFTNNAGGKPNARLVGSVMGVDNIETTKNALILYELWDEQSFLDDTFSLRAGITDVNNEFMYTEPGLNFLSPVMQLSQTLAQTGVNGPPSFPYTTPSIRLKYTPAEEVYAQAAVYNAVAGDPDHLYGNTHFQFDGGAMLIAEAGFAPQIQGVEGKPTLLAVGGWMYTQKADDLLAVDALGTPVRRRRFGAYMHSCYLFYQDEQGRDLDAFFRPSFGDGDTAQVKYAYEVGMTANKWVPGRDEGQFGIGMAQSINGDTYRQSISAGGGRADHSEYAFELYYRDRLAPGFTLQPDFQYIINPGSDPAVGNATVLGLRVDLNF